MVGQGEKPWLKQGHLETCKVCVGTGKKAEQTPANDPEVSQPNVTAPTTDTPDGGEKKDGDTEPNPNGSQDPLPVGAEPYTGPMGKYKITGTAEFTDQNGLNVGVLELGSVQELPTAVGDKFVSDGVAELVEKLDSTPTPDATIEA